MMPPPWIVRSSETMTWRSEPTDIMSIARRRATITRGHGLVVASSSVFAFRFSAFASGDPAEVLKVARAFSVYVEQNGAILDHTLATALVDGNGEVREIWRGNGWNVNDLVAALR